MNELHIPGFLGEIISKIEQGYKIIDFDKEFQKLKKKDSQIKNSPFEIPGLFTYQYQIKTGIFKPKEFITFLHDSTNIRSIGYNIDDNFKFVEILNWVKENGEFVEIDDMNCEIYDVVFYKYNENEKCFDFAKLNFQMGKNNQTGYYIVSIIIE